jgi:cell division protein FtsN
MTTRTAARNVPLRGSGRPSRKSGAGGTLLGIFIGVALGLALAAGVAFYLLKSGNPYQASVPGREPAREAAKEPPRTAKAEPGAAEKPRFDFYKILPGGEEPKVQPRPTPPEKAAAPAEKVARADERPAVAPDKAARPGERFWLQAGSFAAEADAENLKARLALAGWEAAIQQATLPDKGVRYRVRLGPYDNTDELNRVKGELGKRGFDVAVIRY